MTHIVYYSLYQILVTSVNKKIMVNDNTIEKSEKRNTLCLNLYMTISTKAYSMTNPQEISFVLVCSYWNSINVIRNPTSFNGFVFDVDVT